MCLDHLLLHAGHGVFALDDKLCGAGARRLKARDVARKAHVETTGVVHETNGAATLSEERLVEAKEIRLKGIRGADFEGASTSSQIWEWRHRWNIHYENAGTISTGFPFS